MTTISCCVRWCDARARECPKLDNNELIVEYASARVHSHMTYKLMAAVALLVVSPLLALDGQPGLHDPSTVIVAGGQVLRLRHRRRTPDRRSPTMAGPGGGPARVMQALPGGKAGPDVIARGGNNTWAPGRDSLRRQVLHLLLGSRHAAEVRDRAAGRQDARSRLAGLQVGGRRSGRVVRRRRGQQCDRSRCLSRSDQRVALAHLRFVLRLHPPRRVEPEDRQAAVSRPKAASTSRSTPKPRS